MSTPDEAWMREAFKLVRLCPPSKTAYSVGAIVVDREGRELARGYSRDTDPHVHAEESALSRLAGDPRLADAVLYSTLEPCAQRSALRPTCVELILRSGLRQVVIGAREANRFVADPQGYEVLTAAGVKVRELSVLPPAMLP